MNSVITRIEKPHAATGRIMPRYVPMRFTCSSGTSDSTTDSGIAMTSSGSIMVVRIASITSAAPRNRLRARAYDAKMLTAIWSSSPNPTTTNEFSR